MLSHRTFKRSTLCLAKRSRSAFFAFTALLLFQVIVSCSSSVTDQQLEPTAIPVATNTPAPTPSAVPAPSPTSVPVPTPTQVSTPNATAAPAPTLVPTATSTPKPLPTSTPTPSPTPTATPMANVFDWYGFRLAVATNYQFSTENLTITGFSKSSADDEQGSVTFVYNGPTVSLIWNADPEPPLVNYFGLALLENGYPDENFTGFIEKTFNVDGRQGTSMGFVSKDPSGSTTGGGLVGSWNCDHGRQFLLLVKGTDATTAQVRFDRIADNFRCSLPS